jgi:hypothetical protein
MSVAPDIRNFKKLVFLSRNVSQILNSTRYSWMPFAVEVPPITSLRYTKCLIAYSALLLFQGTPS